MTDSDFPDILREKIVPYIKNDAWFQEVALERATWELIELRERMDRFDEERLAIVKTLAVLIGRHPHLLAKYQANGRTRALRELAANTGYLQQRLLACYKSFLRNSYRRYSYAETEFNVEEETARTLRETLVERFESHIKPDVEKVLDIIRDLLQRLDKEMQP